jgi:glycosyltransferase involved in cell wall biosynthesis
LTRGIELETLPGEPDMDRPDRNPASAGVAYVLPGLGRGGTEKHVLELASRIDPNRFSPCVVSTSTDGAMKTEFTERGIPVFEFPYRGLSLRPATCLPLLRDARAFFGSFGRIFTERRIAIVHAYLPAGNVLGMAAALGRSAKVRIVSKRALCRYKEGHPVYSHFEDLANFAADAVMVNSQAVAQDVRRTERFVEGKMFLVYNGLAIPPGEGAGTPAPPPADLGLPADAAPVTYVANLREDKGHLCLVEAAREVVQAYPAVRFLFVGREDSEAARVRERIRQLGLQRHILLIGSRRDVVRILGASRLTVHPGEQEGFSNAILEAMAAGLPVVASDSGGNPEALEDGVSGKLVPAGDAGALTSAILALLRDPVRAEAMGRAAMKRVRSRFSLDGMVTAVEETYTELLDGRPPSRRV